MFNTDVPKSDESVYVVNESSRESLHQDQRETPQRARMLYDIGFKINVYIWSRLKNERAGLKTVQYSFKKNKNI